MQADLWHSRLCSRDEFIVLAYGRGRHVGRFSGTRGREQIVVTVLVVLPVWQDLVAVQLEAWSITQVRMQGP